MRRVRIVGEHIGERKIGGDAGASVHLNCLVDDLQGNVRNRNFDLRNFAARAFRAHFIEHPRSL